MASLSTPSLRLLQVAPEAAVAHTPELRHDLLQRRPLVGVRDARLERCRRGDPGDRGHRRPPGRPGGLRPRFAHRDPGLHGGRLATDGHWRAAGTHGHARHRRRLHRPCGVHRHAGRLSARDGRPSRILTAGYCLDRGDVCRHVVPGEWKSSNRRSLDNPVLNTEGRVTLVDAYLAGAVLIRLVLNAAFGWWWADPLAGLVIVFYGVREGWDALHHEPTHAAG